MYTPFHQDVKIPNTSEQQRTRTDYDPPPPSPNPCQLTKKSTEASQKGGGLTEKEGENYNLLNFLIFPSKNRI